MSERDDLTEQAHTYPSTSAEVRCGNCGQIIGEQFKPGDAYALAIAHRPVCPKREDYPNA